VDTGGNCNELKNKINQENGHSPPDHSILKTMAPVAKITIALAGE